MRLLLLLPWAESRSVGLEQAEVRAAEERTFWVLWIRVYEEEPEAYTSARESLSCQSLR